MNKLKLKAVAIVLGIIAISAGVVFVVQYIPWYVISGVCLLFACYIMYQLILTKLEFDAKIDKLNEKYKQ